MISNDKTASAQAMQSNAPVQYSSSFLDEVVLPTQTPSYPNYTLPNNTLPKNNSQIVMNDVFSMPETMPAKPSDNPDYQIRYNGDGKYTYSLTELTNKLQKDFNTTIDQEKLAKILNVTAQDKGMFTDEDLYMALDNGAKAKNGILEKDELSKLVNDTKKQSKTYSNDGKDSYAIDEFIATLEKKYNVSIDKSKLQQLLGHTFLDQNKPITDADLRKFDIDNNGNLENSELLAMIDKIKDTEAPTNNNADYAQLEAKLNQLIELLMTFLMQQQMSQMKPMPPKGTMQPQPSGIPSSYQSILGTVNSPMKGMPPITNNPQTMDAQMMAMMAMMNMPTPK